MNLLEDTTLHGYLLSDLLKQAFLLHSLYLCGERGRLKIRGCWSRNKTLAWVICMDVTKEIPCLCHLLWEIREWLQQWFTWTLWKVNRTWGRSYVVGSSLGQWITQSSWFPALAVEKTIVNLSNKVPPSPYGVKSPLKTNGRNQWWLLLCSSSEGQLLRAPAAAVPCSAHGNAAIQAVLPAQPALQDGTESLGWLTPPQGHRHPGWDMMPHCSHHPAGATQDTKPESIFTFFLLVLGFFFKVSKMSPFFPFMFVQPWAQQALDLSCTP